MSSDIRHRRLDQQPTVPAETTLRNTIEKDRLLKWDDLPAWAKDNEYIHSGFRPSTNSYLDCLKAASTSTTKPETSRVIF